MYSASGTTRVGTAGGCAAAGAAGAGDGAGGHAPGRLNGRSGALSSSAGAFSGSVRLLVARLETPLTGSRGLLGGETIGRGGDEADEPGAARHGAPPA